MRKICTYLFIICFFALPSHMVAQVTDTLQAVQLFSKKPKDITTSAVPVQQLTKTTLSKLNSVSVADAIKYFSGVVVKDYGGIGGLKTISVRSLGANHTGVMYDGIIVPDAQGGQIDLGRFSLDNIESIQLFNNQPTDILMPARSFASASVIALNSSAFQLNDPSITMLQVKCKAGSFGFINPSLYCKGRFGKHFFNSFNGEYQHSKGDYPFIDYETGQSKAKRINSDIESYRLEYDAGLSISDSNQLNFKLYYYNSKRGLPGTVILYNAASDERLNNECLFAQLTWKLNISAKSRVLISSKYAADYKFYLDPSYPNYAGKLENKFHQEEFYVSAAYSYNIFKSLLAGYSVDYFKDILKRTDQFALSFANPERDNLLHNLALQWKKQRYELNGNLLYTYITEKTEQGPVADDHNEFTPAFSASVQPIESLPLRIRASYKNIFRAPTFDDLYYTNIGNTALRPEYAKLFNIGIAFNYPSTGIIKNTILTTDIYYNRIKDKILAVPRQNLFQWTMLNIGKVDARGIDAALHFIFRQWKKIDLAVDLSYSLQKAFDISDRSSALYLAQLPYTPEHSGSVHIAVNYKKLSFNYNVILSSYRYRLGDQVEENKVDGWATHDISAGFTIASKKSMEYKLLAEVNNVYNQQYEIIKYYPMPRFNYRLGVVATFKK